jgi:Ca2+/Na+ antiporter
MGERFQFGLHQIFQATLFMGVACYLFPRAFDSLDSSRSAAGPVLLVLAFASAGGALGALFRKITTLSLVGAAFALAFMAIVVFVLSPC